MKDYEYTKLCIKRYLDHLEDDFTTRLKWFRYFLDNHIMCRLLNTEEESKMAFGDDTLDPSNEKDHELDKLVSKYNESRKEIQELNFELYRICQYRDWLQARLKEMTDLSYFPRNIIIGDGSKIIRRGNGIETVFEGDWIAIPYEDFEKLRKLAKKL